MDEKYLIGKNGIWKTETNFKKHAEFKKKNVKKNIIIDSNMCMFLSPTPQLPQKDIVAMIFYRCAFVIPGAGWPVERGVQHFGGMFVVFLVYIFHPTERVGPLLSL